MSGAKSRVLCMAAAVVIGVASVALVPSAAGAAAVAGTEVITQPDQTTPLGSGGSATLYGVALPSGASCPGDTAHQGYHVFSYLVPKGVSPASVSFRTGVPSKYFGYIAEGAYFGAVNTAEDTGQIMTLPAEFTWSRLTPQDLFTHGVTSATWEGGIACADIHGVVTDTWNSEIQFTASPTDPGGFTWRVLHPQATSSDLGLVVGAALGAAALGLAALAIVLSRRQRGSGGPTGDRRDQQGQPRHEQLAGRP